MVTGNPQYVNPRFATDSRLYRPLKSVISRLAKGGALSSHASRSTLLIRFLLLFFALPVAAAVLFSCAGPRRISFMAYRPPDYDVSLIKSIAVLRLNANTDDLARAVESRMIENLTQLGYFSVVESDRIRPIRGTLNLVDAVEMGRRLGVDAVLVGDIEGEVSDQFTTETNTKRVLDYVKTVTEYESQPVEETIKVRVKEKGEWVEKTKKVTVVKRVPKTREEPVYKQITYTEKYLNRGGALTATVRMVDVLTGVVLVSRSASQQERHRKLFSSDEPQGITERQRDGSAGGWLASVIETVGNLAKESKLSSTVPEKATIVSHLAHGVSRKLTDQLSPRQISVVRLLQSDKATDRGVKFVRNGQWDQGGREWRKERDLHPTNTVAWNNLGIFYEHGGQYAEAKNAYEQALIQHSGNRVAQQNLSALKSMISALQKQTASLGAKIEETSLGLMVASVLEGTLAERLDLRKGDLISHVNEVQVASVEDLEREVVNGSRLGADLSLAITRAGDNLTLRYTASKVASRTVAIPRTSESPGKNTTAVSPVDVDQVVTSKINRPDALGVIMGIEDYRYAPGAPFARHDALVAYEYFTKSLGLKESNVYLRTDRDATQAEFRKVFDPDQGWLVKRIKPGKTEVFVYFIGHGIPDAATQDAYLVPSDGDPNYPTTGYRLDELYANLNRIPAKQVTVLIDACFSGQVGRGTKVEPLLAGARGIAVQTRRVTLASGIVVLTAAQGNQVSSSYAEKSHGLFTYFILKGLQGEADQNGDSQLTVGELYTYVRAQVQSQAGFLDREQTPEFLGTDTGRVLMQY